MNERIRELAEQAGIEFDDDFPLEPETIYYLKLSDFEKFAELIVRECVEVIKWTPSQFPNDEYVKNITEHFGVRE
jgi:hypothetical protein